MTVEPVDSLTDPEPVTTTYDYDDLAAPAWTDPSGSYEASLDAFGRQVGLVDPLEEAWSWSYRADGAPAEMTAGNGLTTVMTYDALGRLTDKVTDGGDVADYAWTYNRGGVVTKETSDIDGDPTNGETDYTYG